MPWARLDDRFPAHKKVRPLSDAAFRLHVSALCWSAENLTDGKIDGSRLRFVSDVRQPKKATVELVAALLWHEIPGGWQINDWHEYNPSREEVLARRKADAEKKRRQRMSLGDRSGDSPPETVRDSPPESTGESASAPAYACESRPKSRPVVGGSLRDGPQLADADEQQDHHEAEQQEQLALTVRTLQPTWQLGKIREAIVGARLRAGLHRATTALLVVAVAPDSQSPRRVLSDGYWWDEHDSRYAEALLSPRLTEVFEAAS